MPGHTLELDQERKSQHSPLLGPSCPARRGASTESYYVQEYRDLLEQAVDSHLMSDVPLGAFLSGGVDSSAVAALMTKIRREPVETFSVGYAEHSYSELPYARQVAKHIRSVHHEVLVSSQGFFRHSARADLARGRADRLAFQCSTVFRRAARARHM